MKKSTTILISTGLVLLMLLPVITLTAFWLNQEWLIAHLIKTWILLLIISGLLLSVSFVVNRRQQTNDTTAPPLDQP